MGGSDDPHIPLVMRCNGCRDELVGTFAWVCLHPKPRKVSRDWDGVLLSRMVTCSGCGAIDDYTLTQTSLARLRDAALMAHAGSPGRVITGESRLWDGTVTRRPAQAMARLRELCTLHPDRAEAFRRLGNGCERFGLMPDAVRAWEQALALDPNDLEAAYSLAAYWLGAGAHTAKGFAWLRAGIAAIPQATTRPDRGPWPRHLLHLLDGFLEIADDDVALMASWAEGENDGRPVVAISSVDLRRIDFTHLAKFIETADLLALDLGGELPEEEPTVLQVLLSGHGQETTQPDREPPARGSARQGRNAPCPCGSGRKYKRCCGLK